MESIYIFILILVSIIVEIIHPHRRIHAYCVNSLVLISRLTLRTCNCVRVFGFHASVHHVDYSKWNPRDAVQQVFYCTLVDSKCFGCRRHPSSGAQYVQSRSVGTMCSNNNSNNNIIYIFLYYIYAIRAHCTYRPALYILSSWWWMPSTSETFRVY